MKKTTKTILIGTTVTLITILITIFILYVIYKNNKPKEEQNPPISNNNNITNINTNYSIPRNINSNNNTNNNEEKIVTVYIFRGNGCPYCENALEYFNSIKENYPYLEIKSYEVWHNKSNNTLLQLVSTKLKLEKVTSVPFIVIDSNFYLNAYSERHNDTLISEIEKAYENPNYKDIVQEVIEENPNLTDILEN